MDINDELGTITTDSYEGVLRLAGESRYVPPSETYPKRIDWLNIVKGCYLESVKLGFSNFPVDWVEGKVSKFPSLLIFVRYGILRKEVITTSRGRITHYVMPEMDNVWRALHELGYLNRKPKSLL